MFLPPRNLCHNSVRFRSIFQHNLFRFKSHRIGSLNFATYVQGQNDPHKAKIREYFYYIDHNGMLFLDDSRMKNFTSCFKEKVFLNFFFKNIKFNTTDRYRDEFPYVSMCGIERNFIRCDDVPIVFTHIVSNQNDSEKKLDTNFKLTIAFSDLWIPFRPESLYMLPKSTDFDPENDPEDDDYDDDDLDRSNHAGRIYHETDPARFVRGYGLVRSTLAQEIGNCFVFRDRKPVQFRWRNRVYDLDNRLADKIIV